MLDRRAAAPGPRHLAVRRLGFAAALAVLAATLLVATAAPASAHTGLAASDPAADTTVAGPVESVTLTFTKPVTVVDHGTELFDGEGTPVELADVEQLAGEQLRIIPAEALAGTSYGLRWSARAGDGHVIDGTLSFTVGAADGAQPDNVATAHADPPDGAEPAEHEVSGELASALEDSEPSTTIAQITAWLARSVIYAGVLFAIGGIVYLLFVHEGTPSETRRLVFWIRRAALVVLAGVILRSLAMIARTHQGAFSAIAPPENWGHTFGGASGVGLAMAAVGSIAVTLGLRMSIDHTTRILPLAVTDDDPPDPAGHDHGLVAEEPVDVVQTTTDGSGAGVAAGQLAVRTRLTRVRLADSRLALGGAILILFSFVFLGHTASEGPRLLTSLADVVHVGAGAVWSGGAILLAAAFWRRRQSADPVPGALLVARYSRAATVAIVAVALSGLTLSIIILPDVAAVWSTGFGLILAAKTAVVGGLVGLGAINHYRCVPDLEADPFDNAATRLLRRVVTAEVVGFAVVVVLTAALVASSPS